MLHDIYVTSKIENTQVTRVIDQFLPAFGGYAVAVPHREWGQIVAKQQFHAVVAYRAIAQSDVLQGSTSCVTE